MDVRTKIPTNGGDWGARLGETWAQHIDELKKQLGAAVVEVRMPGTHATDVPIVYVARDKVIEALTFLKNTLAYGFLADMTAVDEQGYEVDGARFEVVYNLFSHERKSRIRLKVRVREGDDMPTAVGVWAGAEWAEREIWDMFGIKFRGHPDLRRILMDERWEGHPLRKDYPLRGYQLFPEPEEIHPEMLR